MNAIFGHPISSQQMAAMIDKMSSANTFQRQMMGQWVSDDDHNMPEFIKLINEAYNEDGFDVRFPHAVVTENGKVQICEAYPEFDIEVLDEGHMWRFTV